MTRVTLHIGNKVYSSWSMRPWLALRWARIAFEERVIPLGGVGYGKSKIAEVLAVSPSGRVPALHVGGVTIWDSLAISEWAHERAPEAGLWPADPIDRALARSAAAEMHSSFSGLRRDFPMNLRRDGTPRATPHGEDAAADIARVQEVWAALRARPAAKTGPFLFGERTIADAFYAPVVTRFHSYGVVLSPVAQAYVDAVRSEPDVQAWTEGARAEPWTIESTDSV